LASVDRDVRRSRAEFRRLIFGSSDFKLHEIDVFAEKPQPVALRRSRKRYVTV